MRLLTHINDWLAKLPSTNARIALTLFCVLGTAVRYWAGALWEPSLEWLGFLAAMSGLDTMQFFAKRKTDATHVEAQGKVAEAKARATTMIPRVDG